MLRQRHPERYSGHAHARAMSRRGWSSTGIGRDDAAGADPPGKIPTRLQHPSPIQAAIAAWAPVSGRAGTSVHFRVFTFGPWLWRQRRRRAVLNTSNPFTTQTLSHRPLLWCHCLYQLAALTLSSIDNSILLLWPRGDPPGLLD